MWQVWGKGDVNTGFWLEDVTHRYNLEDLGVDDTIILKMDLHEVGWRGMDWIDMAQDRERWQKLPSMSINLWVS